MHVICFYFDREARAHLDVSTMALAPTRTPSTAGRDMRSVVTNIYLTKRRICVQCNKHLSYQKRDEQSIPDICHFFTQSKFLENKLTPKNANFSH